MLDVAKTAEPTPLMYDAVARLLVAAALSGSATVYAAPGELDTAGFGSGSGKVITSIGDGNDKATAVALQTDGKIVVVGTCDNGGLNSFCVARYLPNGQFDRGFNKTGTVRPDASTTSPIEVSAVALQTDGKIVVAGSRFGGGFWLARYTSDGSADAAFGADGTITTAHRSTADRAHTVALQADGKIVVGGTCFTGSVFDFCVARYTIDGRPDISFGVDGVVTTSIGSPPGSIGNTILSLVVQTDGKSVAVGRCHNGGNFNFCLARYLPSGALDSDFGTAGTTVTHVGQRHDYARAIAMQPDGNIVVVGSCTTENTNIAYYCLARFTTNGSLDTAFNGRGSTVTPIGSGYDYASAIAIQPDKKILIAGYCRNGADNDFCVARYLSNGALDPSFSEAGKSITKIGPGEDLASGVVVQADGMIVVSGSCSTGTSSEFCLARYQGGPNSPKTLTEYVYTPLNYFFLTSRDSDKTALDAAPGWARTGQSFAAQTFAEPGGQGISRFYFDKIAQSQTRGSHFYTLVDGEKAALNALNPTNQALPRLPFNEGVDSYAFPPIVEGVGGRCAAGQTPVYRAFRGQARFPDDPNHRFTTSLTLYNQLVAEGWDGEGVKMCVSN